MNILVNLHIPAISKQFDVVIPNNLRVKSITNMLASTVQDLSNNLFVASGEEQLCSVEKNILLRSNATLSKYGIQNGDHLILM